MATAIEPDYTVDIELTNRCNTHCAFCPRDRTPHQGTMSRAVLERALERVVELRADAARLFGVDTRLSYCGLGEQLLHRDVAGAIRLAVARGFAPSICTNGALLTPDVSRSLVDAGIGAVYVNSGDVGDDYDDVYGLPFERLRDNVVRFVEIADGRAELHIVLVDHHDDPGTIDGVRRFWREQGVRHFYRSPMLNRSGSLDVPGMDYDGSPEVGQALRLFEERGVEPRCPAPFGFPFIGYDGTYYLCSSDWEKRVACGTVFDDAILATVRPRLDAVTRRDPICRHCSQDPVNRVATALRRAGGDPGAEEVQEALAAWSAVSAGVPRTVAAAVDAGIAPPIGAPAPARRRIPVRSTS